MAYRFAVGDRVRVKEDNPGDRKRVPGYIRGKSGIVRDVRGPFTNPVDHTDDRAAVYLVAFDLGQIFSSTRRKETILMDIYEDWLLATE